MSIQNKIERGISRSFIGYSKCGHSLHTFVWLTGEAMRAARLYLFKNKHRGTGWPMVLLHLRATGGPLRHRNPVLIECYEFFDPREFMEVVRKGEREAENRKKEKEGNRERMLYCFEPAELLEAPG